MKHLYDMLLIIMGVVLLGLLYEGTSSSAQTAPPTTPPPKEYVETNFLEFDNLFGIEGILSDSQKISFFKERYKGKYVKWNCDFVDLTQDVFGISQELTMQLKCNPDALTADMFVRLKEDQIYKVMALSMGSNVTFEGKLSKYTEFFGHHADEGIIVE